MVSDWGIFGMIVFSSCHFWVFERQDRGPHLPKNRFRRQLTVNAWAETLGAFRMALYQLTRHRARDEYGPSFK